MNTSFLLPGDNATFTVVAKGIDLLYQWHANGEPFIDEPGLEVFGAQSSKLILFDVFMEGTYNCHVSNEAGSIRSTNAELRICELTVSLISQCH